MANIEIVLRHRMACPACGTPLMMRNDWWTMKLEKPGGIMSCWQCTGRHVVMWRFEELVADTILEHRLVHR